MANRETLPAFDPDGFINVIVEAPRGGLTKCTYDPDLGLFVLGKPLPHGLCYPFDWGFIPSTRGEDGDPLDAMVLHDAACPVGCLIPCRPMAILRVEQTERGRTQRNDRLLLWPSTDKVMKGQDILSARLKRELEQFFSAVVLGSGKSLAFQGWGGADKARAAIRKAVKD